MKKFFTGFCLALFVAIFCAQTVAKAHSFDLASEHSHIHVTDTNHHHDHQNEPHPISQEDSDTTSLSPVFISCDDAISHSYTYSTHVPHFIYVATSIFTISPPIGYLEEAPLRNNSPPGKKSLQLPYFSLAPPQLS